MDFFIIGSLQWYYLESNGRMGLMMLISYGNPMKSLFQDFTNQYALSKTLRFELKPIGNTQQMLVENDVVAEDRIRKEKYEKVKRYFDRLHREFVQEALRDIQLDDLDEYLDIFRKWQQDKKSQMRL